MDYIANVAANKFWPLVAKGDGCWEFMGKSRNGTGRPGVGHRKISVASRERPNYKIYAHRFSWELHNGPIPDGMQVLHACDNPPCVNPAHLFLGTRLDNYRDMQAKGRRRDGHRYGQDHPQARLSNEDVAMIRALFMPGPNRYQGSNSRELAERFGVTQATISGIVYRNYRRKDHLSDDASAGSI